MCFVGRNVRIRRMGAAPEAEVRFRGRERWTDAAISNRRKKGEDQRIAGETYKNSQIFSNLFRHSIRFGSIIEIG